MRSRDKPKHAAALWKHLATEPWWLCLLPALLLVPFLGKAFHIDDPVFLLYAQKIAGEPLRPLAETIVFESAHVQLFDLPHPLLWYYVLAAGRTIFGESEAGLHLLTLLFGVLGLHGLVLLARELGVSAVAACWLFAGSSAFLVMGSTIMPDVPFIGCALAAMGRCARGVREDRGRDLVFAGLLGGAAILIRYSGFAVIGLLLCYPMLLGRWRLRAFVPFLVATAIFGAWELYTWTLYDAPHFLHSLGKWSAPLTTKRALRFGLASLVHLGAQLPLTGLGLVAIALRPRGLVAVLAGAAGAIGLVAAQLDEERRWIALLWGLPALGLLVDSAGRIGQGLRARLREGLEAREALRLLLAFWLVATPFLTIRYAHVAAKYMLLPLPAAILLILDRIEAAKGRARRIGRVWLWVSVPLGAAVGLLVAVSDYRWADTYRSFFAERRLPSSSRGRTFVAGEWGLRYYGVRAGLTHYHGQRLGPDDRLLHAPLVPPRPTFPRPFSVVFRHCLRYSGPFALLNYALHAGFYSNHFGLLPFAPSREVVEPLYLVTPGKRTAPPLPPCP